MTVAAATLARPDLAAGQFYGRVPARRTEAGLILSEVRHDARRQLPMHDHQAPGFYLLLAGDYREWVGSRTLSYRPRTVVFHPAAFRHRDACGEGGVRMFVAELAEPLLSRVEPLLPREPHFECDGLLTTLAARLREEMAADDPAAALVREGIACEMVGALSRFAEERRATPGWLAVADEALRDALDHRWSLAELAAAAGVHPARLARGFRRTYGESVGERLRRLRLEAARDAIARPGCDLAEVAHACGFADQSHLTRAFRRAYGVTPGVFRNRRAHRG